MVVVLCVSYTETEGDGGGGATAHSPTPLDEVGGVGGGVDVAIVATLIIVVILFFYFCSCYYPTYPRIRRWRKRLMQWRLGLATMVVVVLSSSSGVGGGLRVCVCGSCVRCGVCACVFFALSCLHNAHFTKNTQHIGV